MVKNTKGGSGAKKMGRKFGGSAGSSANRALRLVVDEDEMYAAVTKVFGNGMCEVMCNDSKTRLCIIRNKFRGRGKRDNTITLGAWIMVGIRSWESNSEAKLQKCDLLEVYNEGEKQKLKNVNGVELARLVPDNMNASSKVSDADDMLEFSNVDNSTSENIMEEMAQDGKTKLDLIHDDEDNEISIDDI